MVCSILFDIPLSSIPHPEAELTEFIAVVSKHNNLEKPIYSLGRKKITPWIDIKQLKKSFSKGGCVIS